MIYWLLIGVTNLLQMLKQLDRKNQVHHKDHAAWVHHRVAVARRPIPVRVLDKTVAAMAVQATAAVVAVIAKTVPMNARPVSRQIIDYLSYTLFFILYIAFFLLIIEYLNGKWIVPYFHA